MKVRLNVLPFVTLGLVVSMTVACGKKGKSGGGSPGEVVEAITDPENSVVTTASTKLALSSELVLMPAKTSGATAALTSNPLQVASDIFNAHSSDAAPRSLRVRVSNDAFENLESVSNIMCFFSQTKFWEQANAGVYKAIIDGAKCEKDSGGDQGSGQEGGGGNQGKKELVTAYVETVREENKPLLGKIRFIMERDGNTQEYHGNITVAAPPSDVDPAGVFSLYFNGYANGTATGAGFIKTKRADGGKFVVEFAEESNEERDGQNKSYNGYAIAELTKDGDEFVGKINTKSDYTESYQGQSRDGGNEYKVAFDKNFMKVAGSKTFFNHDSNSNTTQPVDKCFDRNAFVTNIFNYDVVDGTGNVVELNSGFPIEYTSADGKILSGHAGYWGVHMQGDAMPNAGDTINKVSWAEGQKSVTPYTFVKAAGKMVSYTKASTTLGALKGVDMSMWDNQSNKNYLVRWNGSALTKVAEVSHEGGNGPVESPVTGSTAVQIPEWGLFLHVQSLNAGIKFSSSDTLSDSFVVAYHSEKTVSGTSEAPTGNLVCFENCPKMAVTATDLQHSQGGPQQGCPPTQGAYKTVSETWGHGDHTTTCQSNNARDMQAGSKIATYTFDNSTLLLKEGNTSFSLTTSGSTNPDQLNGVYSGPLIPEATYNALSSSVKSKWPGAAQTEVATFYRWQAGARQWDTFTALKDSAGAIVSFEKPLDILYTHTAANDFDNNSNSPAIGKQFRLQYGGPGQLWGFPFKYNSDLGYATSLFSLKPASKLNDTYTAYPINGDQYNKVAADSASCASLDLSSLPELPQLENRSVKHEFGDASSPMRYMSGESVE